MRKTPEFKANVKLQTSGRHYVWHCLAVVFRVLTPRVTQKLYTSPTRRGCFGRKTEQTQHTHTFTFRVQNARHHNTTTADKSFQTVEKFKYMGTTLADLKSMHEKLRAN